MDPQVPTGASLEAEADADESLHPASCAMEQSSMLVASITKESFLALDAASVPTTPGQEVEGKPHQTLLSCTTWQAFLLPHYKVCDLVSDFGTPCYMGAYPAGLCS